MIRIVAIYPNTVGSWFDGASYTGRHTALAQGLLEPYGLQDITTSLGVAALDGAPPPFWAISKIRSPSREAFDAAMAVCGEALFADLPNYTDAVPVLQLCSASA